MIMFLIVGDVKSEPRNNTAGLRVNIHKQVQLIGQQIRMRIFLQIRVRWVDLLALRCVAGSFPAIFQEIIFRSPPPARLRGPPLPPLRRRAAPGTEREREDEAAGNRNSCGRSFPCDRHVLACVCAWWCVPRQRRRFSLFILVIVVIAAAEDAGRAPRAGW